MRQFLHCKRVKSKYVFIDSSYKYLIETVLPITLNPFDFSKIGTSIVYLDLDCRSHPAFGVYGSLMPFKQNAFLNFQKKYSK